MSETAVATLESIPVSVSKVQAAANEINIQDPTLSLSYGTKTMQEIAKFADSVLGNVRVKNSGPVGQELSDLMLRVKDVDVSKISGHEKGFLESIPFIGSLFNKVEKTVAQFNTVSGQIDTISGKLEESMYSLLKNIAVLDQLYEHNKVFYEDLTAHIQAGEAFLAKAREEELPKLEAEARENPETLAGQNLRDYADKLTRFERRIHDLKLSRTITLQTAPQIRMIQNNDQTLAEKIQTSILATIPIWKNQMVLALSIYGQKQAVNLQREVADTTNSMLVKNAEMLKQSTTETAREVERSIVDIESLKTVHEKLLSTIEETMTIAQEGRERRQAAEQELQTMENNLRERLIDLASQKNRQQIEAARGTAANAVEGTVEQPRIAGE